MGGPWHSLLLEVTPQTIRASWDGQAIGPLATADFAATPQKALAELDASWRRQHPYVGELTFAFRPRLPLGLYVARGSAAFRNVVLEPLPVTPEHP
jgi:hypothetical protein